MHALFMQYIRTHSWIQKGKVCTSLTKIIIATTGFAGLRLAGFIVGAIVLEKLNDPEDHVTSYHCSSAYAAGMVISVRY